MCVGVGVCRVCGCLCVNKCQTDNIFFLLGVRNACKRGRGGVECDRKTVENQIYNVFLSACLDGGRCMCVGLIGDVLYARTNKADRQVCVDRGVLDGPEKIVCIHTETNDLRVQVTLDLCFDAYVFFCVCVYWQVYSIEYLLN